jgi:cysteine desulfurase
VTPIYLDYNASTPPAPEAVAAMRPWLGEAHANPHAEHLGGRRAAAAVDKALASIGALIGADAQDLVLTSGATEANNLALLGILATNDPGTAQLLHSSVEHKSVIEVAKHLKSGGVCVASLSVNQEGRVDVESLTTSVSNKTFNRSVVSVMHANNEVGTVQPIGEISRRLQPFGNLLHVDAAQTAGKIPIDVNVLGADLLTISSHKLYGPAGIGALYISPRARALIRPIMFGGGQQGGLRSGTVPVFLAVGFGSACALATERIADDATHSEMVANAFLTQLAKDGIPFDVLGDAHARLPGSTPLTC